MTLESDVANIHEHFFYREFTFSKNTFSPPAASELELADNVVWVDDCLIVYQIKERGDHGIITPDTEARWFERTVKGKAVKQLKDTHHYISNNEVIEVANHRGDKFNLAAQKLRVAHSVVLYGATELLPLEYSNQKFYQSATIGFVHIFNPHNYRKVLTTLLTVKEFDEYLSFRALLIENWGNAVNDLPEEAILGQYLSYISPDIEPSVHFVEAWEELEHNISDWDISGIISRFPERTTYSENPQDYYSILRELTKLNRSALKQFKERFSLAMKNAGQENPPIPYRMFIPDTGCAFVFVPVPKGLKDKMQSGLANFTLLQKYDSESEKCIGASFYPVDGGWHDVCWIYMESPWEHDSEIEKELKANYPFREAKEKILTRYSFKQ